MNNNLSPAGFWSVIVTLAIIVAPSAYGQDPLPNVANTSAANLIGMRVLDLNGNIQRIGLQDRLKPVVVVLLDTGCPIANRYAPELNEFSASANSKGVEFYGVLSDPLLTLTEARKYRDEYDLKFPIIWDSNGELAVRLKPTHFPECFVVNKKDKVVYRGRIDNRFVSVGVLRANITAHDLKDAIDAIANNKKPAQSYVKPVGCVYEAWGDKLPEKLTFNRHVAPIIYSNCTACHREGEVAPFSLENFEQTERRAEMIGYTAEERLMPPWQAQPGFGHFLQERFLSDRQIDILRTWGESELNEGDDKNKIAAPKFSNGGWALGKPDLELTMPKPFSVPAIGKDIYRYFVISNPMPEDLVITALDFKPGDPTVVHHMNSFVDLAGRARKLDSKDGQPGFSVFGTGSFMSYDGSDAKNGFALGGWVPGMGTYKVQPDYGIYIPKGGEIVIEIHYHLSGKATTDQSKLAMYLAKKPVKKYLDGTVIGTQQLEIQEGNKNYQRHFWMDVPADIDLVDILPHMHYIGTSAKVVATLPDGKKLPLVNIKNWDFRWQSLYTFREPIRLPSGSRIDAWFSFDNSADNPANPLPKPGKVGWGWETGDEMAEVWLAYVTADSNDREKIYQAADKSWYRSGDPNDNSAFDVQATVKRLSTESLWSAKGEALLLKIYSSGKVPTLLTQIDKELSKQNQNTQLWVAKGAVIATLTWDEQDVNKSMEISIKADAAFDKALAIDGNDWDAWMTKAAFYGAAQDDGYEKEALTMFQQLIDGQEQYEQLQHYFKAYLEYGNLHAERGNPDAARKIWERGLKYFPKNEILKAAHKKL